MPGGPDEGLDRDGAPAACEQHEQHDQQNGPEETNEEVHVDRRVVEVGEGDLPEEIFRQVDKCERVGLLLQP